MKTVRQEHPNIKTEGTPATPALNYSDLKLGSSTQIHHLVYTFLQNIGITNGPCQNTNAATQNHLRIRLWKLFGKGKALKKNNLAGDWMNYLSITGHGYQSHLDPHRTLIG